MPGNQSLPSTGERVPVSVLVLEVVCVAAVGSRAARGPPEEAFLLRAATAPEIISHLGAAVLGKRCWVLLQSGGFLPGSCAGVGEGRFGHAKSRVDFIGISHQQRRALY